MEIWKNCRYDTLYYDSEAVIDEVCDVTIDKDKISVSYDYDGKRVTYLGQMNGPGHYELQCPEMHGRATLHRFETGRVLEGYWTEGGGHGMWRITLTD